jgi:Mg2+/Co2+ transporter CorC
VIEDFVFFFLQETLFSQHLLVCALTEVGELALQLGTSVQNLVNDTSLNMINAIFSVSDLQKTENKMMTRSNFNETDRTQQSL